MKVTAIAYNSQNIEIINQRKTSKTNKKGGTQQFLINFFEFSSLLLHS